MKHISSRQNPLVARFRTVARGDDRSSMLLDGVHLVTDALAAHVRVLDVAVAHAALETDAVAPLAAALAASGATVWSAASAVMDLLSPVRSASPIVALAERPTHPVERVMASTAGPLIVAAGIQDPGNLGAIVRVAEAGGAVGVVAAQSADPFGWKALRGSMGSALRLPVAAGTDVTDTIATARRSGWRVIATTPRGGLAPDAADLTERVAFLIGGEGQGLSAEAIAAADVRLSIPMAPPVESLNAAVCAALLVYEARRQRLAASPLHGLAVPGRA